MKRLIREKWTKRKISTATPAHQLAGASVYRVTSERIRKKMHFYTVARAFRKGFSKSVGDFAFPEQKIFKCNCALRRPNAVQQCGENLIAVLQRCNFVPFYQRRSKQMAHGAEEVSSPTL